MNANDEVFRWGWIVIVGVVGLMVLVVVIGYLLTLSHGQG
jgi:hypothetical protein